MRRLLVRRCGLGIAIHFHQDEAGGVVLLLDHIKAHNARFLQTQARIPEGGGFECLHEFKLNPDMNMNIIHAQRICGNRAMFKREENRRPWCCMRLIDRSRHCGWSHLAANSLPFAILGFLVMGRGERTFWAVSAGIVVLGGLAVWLFGRGQSVHVGASGLIFGYFGYGIPLL